MPERGYIEDPKESVKANRKVFIRLAHDRYSPRRYTRYKRGSKHLGTYAAFLWQKYHPEDPILEDENIHHKDFDSLNDDINNLVKLKKTEHELLHKREGENYD